MSHAQMLSALTPPFSESKVTREAFPMRNWQVGMGHALVTRWYGWAEIACVADLDNFDDSSLIYSRSIGKHTFHAVVAHSSVQPHIAGGTVNSNERPSLQICDVLVSVVSAMMLLNQVVSDIWLRMCLNSCRMHAVQQYNGLFLQLLIFIY